MKQEIHMDIDYYMNRLNLPQAAQSCFKKLEEQIAADEEINKRFSELVEAYMDWDNTEDILLKVENEIANEIGVHEDTVHFLFFLSCCPILLKRYHEKGIDEQIFWDSMADLRYKLIECWNTDERWGTFTGDWYNGFFRMRRFMLGRLQFEYTGFDADTYAKAGYTLKRGDRVINIHIPSAGPLTWEKRLDAYKRAYKMFGNADGTPAAFVCSSWLLYPKHTEFLPENSNILDFMKDFDIIKSHEKDTFSNAWRVYGKYGKEEPEKWPQDTGLRKAYANWMLSGNKAGGGYGVFFFDGEKIIK